MLSESETHFATAFQIVIPTYVGLPRRFPPLEPFFLQLLLYALKDLCQNVGQQLEFNPPKRKIHRPFRQKSKQACQTKRQKALRGAGKGLNAIQLQSQRAHCTPPVRCALHTITPAQHEPRHFNSTDQYAWSRNCFQERYLSWPRWMCTRGLCLGLTGFWVRCMLACLGVRPPFLTLHLAHAHTIFVQVAAPPMLRGTTWSRESSLVGKRLPQYWQLFLSRAKMFRRLNLTSVRGSRS